MTHTFRPSTVCYAALSWNRKWFRYSMIDQQSTSKTNEKQNLKKYIVAKVDVLLWHFPLSRLVIDESSPVVNSNFGHDLDTHLSILYKLMQMRKKNKVDLGGLKFWHHFY